ncbi:MAG: hypothetical protein FVQ81_06785 [Candidatus Glassbacteria bacterium]|nr:hypothetical protein [Candidatus Glassbacteria bacterium]
MAKEVAVVAIHGMGDTKSNFDEKFKSKLSKILGDDISSKVHFDKVYYQNILQNNEEIVFQNMEKEKIDCKWLRKFILFGFSDATGLERNSEDSGSPYTKAQKAILNTLENCSQELGGFDKPLIFVAHSLGCQLLSNFIWDSQQIPTKKGIWLSMKYSQPEENNFYRLKKMHSLFTIGCNIPVFVSGFPQVDIKAIATQDSGYNFVWYNYYDRDDVLGWPLKPLSPSYNKAVKADYEINATGGFLGFFLKSWNIFSHNNYFTDSDVLKPISTAIRKAITP